MPCTIHHCPPPVPAVLVRVTGPLDPVQDTALMVGRLDTLLRDIETDPVYLVVDVSQLEMSLSEMMLALSSITQAWDKLETAHSFRRRVRINLVGSGDPLQMVVDSLREGDFGTQPVQMFQTADEALAYAEKAWTVTQILKRTVSRKKDNLSLEAGRQV